MANEVMAFIGKGQIYAKRLDKPAGYLPIGEASAFQLSIDTDEKTLPSNTQRGGGVAATAYSVTNMGLSITGHSFTDENLAMILYGDATASLAAEVTDEPVTAYVGAFVPFAKIPDLDEEVTVKAAEGSIEYVAGTDYTLSPAGLKIITGGSIANASELLVSYKTKAQSAIEILTNSGYEYGLFFEGFNDADNGKEFNVEIYRTKFSPTSGLGFIQDDFAESPLEGQAMVDPAKSGAGVSKYAKITRV